MTEEEALDLFEEGKASGVYATTIVMEHNGIVWFSFDGIMWEQTQSPLMKKILEDD